MAEDPNHPWGSGATRFNYTPEIHRIVHKVRAIWPQVVPNTYVCHPWCGWSRYSVDFWGSEGRGDALARHLGPKIRSYLMQLPGEPLIRHTIWEHQLWTSWGGKSYWARDDHSGGLRHLHVTYWPS
jgi:hypothetical protein